ncbi:MAG: hypothetical protein Solumvirus3_11 [Solumvirus sp.]|uniref:Uncharacterized protein n=1 Tax=Solumvirus sp. TaxID=2487773 RepID=A0A3G5AGD4_9VIRU|nr:MAG: hypothetical protein Solumvirus3_11 [Solumvirus sp.]
MIPGNTKQENRNDLLVLLWSEKKSNKTLFSSFLSFNNRERVSGDKNASFFILKDQFCRSITRTSKHKNIQYQFHAPSPKSFNSDFSSFLLLKNMIRKKNQKGFEVGVSLK